MDELSIFKALEVGAKFDFKRFRSDAERLQILPSKGRNIASQVNREAADQHGNKSSEDELSGSELDADEGAVQAMSMTEEERQRAKQRHRRAQKNWAKKQAQKRFVELRVQHKIYVTGARVPNPVDTFETLRCKFGLSARLMENIRTSGYAAPTPIQMQAVPAMIQGRNIMACAPTGSGKTAAFLIPLLHTLLSPDDNAGQKQRDKSTEIVSGECATGKEAEEGATGTREEEAVRGGGSVLGGFRALILAPVRELVQQIQRECERFGEGLGVSCISSKEAESRAWWERRRKRDRKCGGQVADILVTTPMLLMSLMKQKPPAVSLEAVRWLVVDECDRLFEEGGRGLPFRTQLGGIYRECTHPQLRRALFSATFAQDVEHWCRNTFPDLVQVYVGAKNSAVSSVEQSLVFTGNEAGKLIELRNIIKHSLRPPALVFVQSKERAEQLCGEIAFEGVAVAAIHADKSQTERDEAIKKIRCGELWVLVCTQLMGRGIDFIGVNLVVNYDFPLSAISYIHAVGRTGRAGRSGRAITFFTDKDKPFVRSIADLIRNAGCPVPEYILTFSKATRSEQRQLKKRAPKRTHISTVPLSLLPSVVKTEKIKELKKRKAKVQKLSQGKNPDASEAQQGPQAAGKKPRPGGAHTGRKPQWSGKKAKKVKQ